MNLIEKAALVKNLFVKLSIFGLCASYIGRFAVLPSYQL